MVVYEPDQKYMQHIMEFALSMWLIALVSPPLLLMQLILGMEDGGVEYGIPSFLLAVEIVALDSVPEKACLAQSDHTLKSILQKFEG